MESIKRIEQNFLLQSKKIPGYRMKNPDGSWNYIINPNFDCVIEYMERNKNKTFLDLGGGMGHGIILLNKMGIKTHGYEINDYWIHEHNKLSDKHLISKKDILNLTYEDIKDFNIVYSYSPFRDIDLKKRFLKNVFNILDHDQTFIYTTDKKKNLELIDNNDWMSVELGKDTIIFTQKKRGITDING